MTQRERLLKAITDAIVNELHPAAKEFEIGYAQRSGVTVDDLHRSGKCALPCNCGDGLCAGYQMISLRSLANAVGDALSTPTKEALMAAARHCAASTNNDFDKLLPEARDVLIAQAAVMIEGYLLAVMDGK